MKGSIALDTIAIIVLVIVGGIALLLIIGKFSFGEAIYYSGCEGNLDGQMCYESGARACGITPTKYSKFLGTAHPICTIYSDKSRCELAFSIIIGDEKMPFCVWVGGFSDSKCLVNPLISCGNLNQATSPKCSSVPRCQPVSVLKEASEFLRRQVKGEQ